MSAKSVNAMDKKMFYVGCSPLNEADAEKWARAKGADTWIYNPATKTVYIVAKPVSLPEMMVKP